MSEWAPVIVTNPEISMLKAKIEKMEIALQCALPVMKRNYEWLRDMHAQAGRIEEAYVFYRRVEDALK